MKKIVGIFKKKFGFIEKYVGNIKGLLNKVIKLNFVCDLIKSELCPRYIRVISVLSGNVTESFGITAEFFGINSGFIK